MIKKLKPDYFDLQILDKTKAMLGISVDHFERTFTEPETFFKTVEIRFGLIFIHFSFGYIQEKV